MKRFIAGQHQFGLIEVAVIVGGPAWRWCGAHWRCHDTRWTLIVAMDTVNCAHCRHHQQHEQTFGIHSRCNALQCFFFFWI